MRESKTMKTFQNQEQGLALLGCINLFPKELSVSFTIFLEMNYVQHAGRYLSYGMCAC